jgi:hypothetical protein
MLVKDLHQIEITSRCNLRCVYCPSRHLPRPKVDMTFDHFSKAIKWIEKFIKRGYQTEVNLAGIGESTMHPEFVYFISYARAVLDFDVRLVFATNGLLMNEELAKAIAPYKPVVYVSMHRPEKAGPAVEALRKYGLLAGVSADPTLAATDWAGQVKWFNSVPVKRTCQWVRNGKVFMLADGRISRCAYDATGDGVFAHVDDEDLDKKHTSAWSLCATCDQEV